MSAANPVISSDDEQLILVNEDDEPIGKMAKRDCHLDQGVLHRAFSIFIFNAAGDLLLQRRSGQKFLWPGYWSNACCSHPREGEDSEEAAHRRLEQELGIKTELTFLYKFTYRAQFGDIGSENELCWVWAGQAEANEVTVNDNEIADWKFFTALELEESLALRPQEFTPWMKMEWNRIRAEHNQIIPGAA
ncbi:MAG: isopentenyl-diphosphate Delta-isomerase [Pseudomonadales bacterium]